jgi:hypothetical protein
MENYTTVPRPFSEEATTVVGHGWVVFRLGRIY